MAVTPLVPPIDRASTTVPPRVDAPPAAAPTTPPRRRRHVALWAALGIVVAVLGTFAASMIRMMAHPAPPADVGTVKVTANGRYRVLFEAEATPVPLHRVHRWTVRVQRSDGGAADGPVSDAGTTARVPNASGAPRDGVPRTGVPRTGVPLTVTVDGGMPQHGHGLPTQPRVTGRLPDGRLVIDGMEFSMPGWWALRLRISGPAGTDSVTFNLAL